MISANDMYARYAGDPNKLAPMEEPPPSPPYSKKQLTERLKKGPLSVTFTKVDGNTRTLICTLEENTISSNNTAVPMTEQINRRENNNVVAAWDVENKGWRSFRVDSIKEVENV